MTDDLAARIDEGPDAKHVPPIADAAIAAWAAADIQRVSDWAVEKDLQPVIKSINEMIRRLVGGETPDEVDERSPQERALPRPSSTPPMWAVDHRRDHR